MRYFLSDLFIPLYDHLQYQMIHKEPVQACSVLLLESAADFDPGFLCIGSPGICREVLSQQRTGTLLLAAEPGQEDALVQSAVCVPEEMNFLCTSLPAPALCNLLNRFFSGQYGMVSALQNSAPYTLHQLVKNAHELSGCSIVLLDEKLRFLYDKVTHKDSRLIGSLLLDSSENPAPVSLLLRQKKDLREPVFFEEEGSLFLLIPFQKSAGYLLFSTTEKERFYTAFAFSLAELCEPLLLNQKRVFPAKDMSFQLLFSRILAESSETDETCILMLHNLPNPPKKNMRLVLVRSEQLPYGEEDPSLLHLLEPLKEFFPETNLAVMGDEIVILLSSEIHYCPLEFSTEAFEGLLARHHAAAMIGNPFTSITALRVMYRQCHRMFPIAMAVRLDGEVRCMNFARYTQYNVIDICARSIKSILGGSDIVILCHPGVLTLTRYDRAYGTNLRDVMFHYLMNDRSITRTSAKMFMHRNTTIYKVKKIEELIGESMDDPYLRHNLIFSCLLLRYRELYQKEGISLSVFENPGGRARQRKKAPKEE